MAEQKKVPPSRVECDHCHQAIIIDRQTVGEIQIPSFFLAEHAHAESVTVSVVSERAATNE